MRKALKYIIGGATGAGLVTLLIGGTALAEEVDPVVALGEATNLLWVVIGAVIATRPASMPFTCMPGSGLPVRNVIQYMPTTAPTAPAMAVFAATVANWMSVTANVEAALKPNQPNSRMKQPS